METDDDSVEIELESQHDRDQLGKQVLLLYFFYLSYLYVISYSHAEVGIA